MRSRFTLSLILGIATLAAIIALSFWSVLAAASALCAALVGGMIAGLSKRQIAAPRLTSAREASANLRESSEAGLKRADEAGAVGQISSGALLEATMESMREGVLVVDERGRVVAINRAAQTIFADNFDSRSRQRLTELTRNPTIHEAFRAALERGQRAECQVERPGAERRVFDLRVAPLRFGARGESRGVIGVFFDITQLERLERVRQEFLSNVSHELRTPLTAIIAFVETLEDGALEDAENNHRFLQVIRRNATRMHNLIDDILELSAIEAGNVQVEPQPVRLHPLVEDVLTALNSRAEARRVTLLNEVGAATLVYADARRLEQMLTNLIDNAIKFNREGGKVTITHEAGERDRISVADTGDGIPDEHTARIFERFYRVDRARSREMGGTGLGLAIVKHLARAHGGEASVLSTHGAGSTFTIELPKMSLEPQV